MRVNIKQTRIINKKNFDHVIGERIYYSPITTWLTASILIIFIMVLIYLMASDKNFDFVFFICFAFSIYFLYDMIHKVIYKNPVFIINGNQLFYTKNEKWYDLTQCNIDEKYTKFLTTILYIKYKDNEGFFDPNLIDENYWYIENEFDLKRIIKKFC